MMLTDDADAAQKKLDELDIELKRWMQDPECLAAVLHLLARVHSDVEVRMHGDWRTEYRVLSRMALS